ncbi:hypothetical protein Y1Q_0001184 [Alligator mississippiensis]|uniref:Uncharacterized protein n=1 Tax=Alligator mississippiensis TaxID=8496 RepID=A0A151PEG6_ALLMI|nr:hypothetical protein Y1Q_0001184 [Alligator mississippiensis]
MRSPIADHPDPNRTVGIRDQAMSPHKRQFLQTTSCHAVARNGEPDSILRKNKFLACEWTVGLACSPDSGTKAQEKEGVEARSTAGQHEAAPLSACRTSGSPS